MKILSLLLLAATAVAQTPVADGSSLTEFAFAARPYWKFSRALDHDTCWPSYATNSSGDIVEAAELKAFPVAGQGGCPDVLTSFPVYWVGRQCAEGDIRIAYNLFFKKDGFALAGTSVLGHEYDWERVIVKWNKTDDGYVRTSALYSQHLGQEEIEWLALETSAELAIDTLATDLDHPSAYVAWAKHLIYEDAKTGFTSSLDQFTGNAYRSDDYKWLNSAAELIEVSLDSELWTKFDAYDWGSASSDPVYVYGNLCE